MPAEEPGLPPEELNSEDLKSIEEAVAADAEMAGALVEPEINNQAQEASEETADTTAARHVDVQHISDNSSDIPDSVIQDKDKAWEVAHASKSLREDEVKTRNKARKTEHSGEIANELSDKLRSLEREVSKLQSEYADKTDSFSRDYDTDPEAAEYRAKRDELEALTSKLDDLQSDDRLDIPYELRDVIRRAKYLRPEESQKAIAEVVDREVENYKKRERQYASEADKVEEWAGILHDHPVSEEYKKEHPDFRFMPHDLVYIENLVAEELDDVIPLEKALEEAPLTVGIDGLNEVKYLQHILKNEWGALSPYNVMRSAYGREPKDVAKADDTKSEVVSVESSEKVKAWEKFHALLTNPDTTLGQLRDMYIETFRKAHIESRKSWAEHNNAILDDIRSGRAAEK